MDLQFTEQLDRPLTQQDLFLAVDPATTLRRASDLVGLAQMRLPAKALELELDLALRPRSAEVSYRTPALAALWSWWRLRSSARCSMNEVIHTAPIRPSREFCATWESIRFLRIFQPSVGKNSPACRRNIWQPSTFRRRRCNSPAPN